jgi:hypothetical protein
MTPGLLPDGVRSTLREATTVDLVCDIVKRAARQAVGAQGATFVLADGDQCFYADEDAIAPLWRGQRFPMSQCISGWAMTHDEQVAIPEVRRDERVPLAAYAPTFVHGMLMTPVGHPPCAAIGVYWAAPHRATAEQAAVVRDLAEETADALERIGLDSLPQEPWSAMVRRDAPG